MRINWKGLTVTGSVVKDDWEGDPSIPNGTNKLDPYVNDLDVLAGKISIAGSLDEDGVDFFEGLLLEADNEQEEDVDD